MASIIKIPADEGRNLRPIQKELIRSSFAILLKLLDEDNLKKLLPCVGKRLDNGEIAIIDGTHRTFLKTLVGQDHFIYLPEQEGDIMQYENFPINTTRQIDETNRAIDYCFQKCDKLLIESVSYGFRTFEDMIRSYKIQNVDDLRRFVRGEIDHRFAVTLVPRISVL